MVDFDKLDRQIQTSLAVTRELASTSSPPAFASGTPVATFDDVIAASRVVNRAYADRARFSAADQEALTRDSGRRAPDRGRGQSGVRVRRRRRPLGDAARFVALLTHGSCSGFLSASARSRVAAYGAPRRSERRGGAAPVLEAGRRTASSENAFEGGGRTLCSVGARTMVRCGLLRMHRWLRRRPRDGDENGDYDQGRPKETHHGREKEDGGVEAPEAQCCGAAFVGG